MHRGIRARSECSVMADHVQGFSQPIVILAVSSKPQHIQHFRPYLSLLDFVTLYRVLFLPGPQIGTTEKT
jgi:hypothetical protein